MGDGGIEIHTWVSHHYTRFELRLELGSPERSEFSGELCRLVIVSLLNKPEIESNNKKRMRESKCNGE